MNEVIKEWINKGEADYRTAESDLSGSSISFRYPGESADKNDAEEALQICRDLRKKLHSLLD